MGGDSKSKSSGKHDTPAAVAAPAPIQQFPSAMPGQLEAIAAQIGMGYGQQPTDIMSYLQKFTPPAPAAPGPAPAKDWSKEIRGTFEDDYHRMKAAGKTIPGWMEQQYGGKV